MYMSGRLQKVLAILDFLMWRVGFAGFIFIFSIHANAEQITGQVVGVSDGDTLTLLVRNSEIKVRLEFIDAPEKKQAFGDRAKRELSDLVYAKRITCERSGFDRYGRSLATCSDGALDVNLEMVRRGMAWVFRRYAKNKVPAYFAAENDARQSKRGLWSDPHPIEPWKWRENRRNSRKQ